MSCTSWCLVNYWLEGAWLGFDECSEFDKLSFELVFPCTFLMEPAEDLLLVWLILIWWYLSTFDHIDRLLVQFWLESAMIIRLGVNLLKNCLWMRGQEFSSWLRLWKSFIQEWISDFLIVRRRVTSYELWRSLPQVLLTLSCRFESHCILARATFSVRWSTLLWTSFRLKVVMYIVFTFHLQWDLARLTLWVALVAELICGLRVSHRDRTLSCLTLGSLGLDLRFASVVSNGLLVRSVYSYLMRKVSRPNWRKMCREIVLGMRQVLVWRELLLLFSWTLFMNRWSLKRWYKFSWFKNVAHVVLNFLILLYSFLHKGADLFL